MMKTRSTSLEEGQYNEIQYAGCLFMINFQLQLPHQLRNRSSFDPRLEFYIYI